MLCLNTRDDWHAATVGVVIGVTAHTWTCTADNTNALDALTDFCAWLPSAFAGRSVSLAFARNTADSGLLARLSFSTTVTMTPNAAATALLGFSSATGATLTAGASAWGTWAPEQAGGRISQALDYPVVDGNGDAAAGGAIRAGVPGLGFSKPQVDAFGTAVDAGRLTAMMANLPNVRRRGWFYRAIDGGWREFQVGAVQRSPAGRNLYKFAFDVSR